MKYVNPELENLEIEAIDVITASEGSLNGGVGEGGDSDEDNTPGIGFRNIF